jgi:mRNA interferase RelE/StbE
LTAGPFEISKGWIAPCSAVPLSYLEERIAQAENLRDFGEGLTSRFAGLWRYRVGDYRMVCRIEDDRLVVFVVRIGHRREVYD